MASRGSGEVERLRHDVERALQAGLDAEEILPMLARLARTAPADSDAWIFAHRHLAEIGVEHDPWRAALFARRVIALRPDDDGAWAVLGLSQSLLGHHRYAARAYERALSLSPENPWYAHNLGHLYDVALGRPDDALPLLERATLAQPGETDIAASYAHALARCGRVASAKRVLKRAIRRGATADQMALWRWLAAGAPARWPRRGAPEPADPAPEPVASGPSVPVASGPSVPVASGPGLPDAPPEAAGSGAAPEPGGGKKPKRRRARGQRSMGD
jgi:Flp pilus assembly protein TadD